MNTYKNLEIYKTSFLARSYAVSCENPDVNLEDPPEVLGMAH